MTLRTFGHLSAAALLLVVCAPPPPANDESPSHITRVGDDLLGSGDEMYLADSVAGDVMIAGGKLGFSGQAGGSYLGTGGDQTLGGRIAGSVRAIGGNLVMSADVGRNITLAGGNIVIDSSAAITHNAYLAGGNVRVRGSVGQALFVRGGEVTLDGAIGGDVDVGAQKLRVGPNARITGSLRHRVPTGGVTIDPASRITGGVTSLPSRDWRVFGRMLRSIWVLGFLVAGAVVVAIFPRLAAAAETSTRERAGVSASFGVAWLFGIPMLIALAAVTMVGLPLAGLIAAAYVVLLYLGRAAIAVWLGELIVRRWNPAMHVTPVVSFLIGGVLLVLVGLIPVIGPFVGLVAMVMGAGAVLVALWPRRQPQMSV